LVVLVASGLGLAACGSSGPPATSATTTTTAGATAPAATNGGAATTASIPTADRSPAGTAGSAPTVVVPSGSAPTQLESADLITGTGAVAADGDNVTVQYVLATYSSHKVIQSSWTSQPFQFVLGKGQVIPGWDKGVVGMRVGGRRELIIPPALGYGAQSPGPGIAANDTLVFVIDLQKVG
jgi:peptidylprolyl isomerase